MGALVVSRGRPFLLVKPGALQFIRSYRSIGDMTVELLQESNPPAEAEAKAVVPKTLAHPTLHSLQPTSNTPSSQQRSPTHPEPLQVGPLALWLALCSTSCRGNNATWNPSLAVPHRWLLLSWQARQAILVDMRKVTRGTTPWQDDNG